MNRKSTVEDALIQIKNVEEAINKNAEGILASTMREEISSLVKESLKEQDEIEEPETLDVDDEETVIDDTEMDDEDMEDIDMDGEEMDDVEMIDFDDETGGVDEFSMDDETIDMTGASDAEVLKVFKAMSDSDGIVVTKNDNIISLNDGDNEYMIKINEEEEVTDMLEYDELEEMFNNDELSEMEDEDFLSGADKNWDKDFDFSKLNDEDEEEDEMDFDFSKLNDEDEEEDEMDFETIYEIEMDDEEMDLELDEEEDEIDFEEDEFMLETKNFKPKGLVGKVKKVDFKSNTQGGFNEKRKEAFGGKKEKADGTGKAKFTYKDGENLDGEFKVKPKKVEAKEASRFVKSIDRKVKRGLMAAPKQIKEEVEMLRTKNEEYRKALDLFRSKLDEVAVFNSNLAYATRLFTEHSTSKQEKINILRRFDNVETLKESKNLYRIIKDEISSSSINESTSINESINRTVNKTVSSGSAVNLIESKTYENPQFLRMKDLMSKIK
jgi:DNA-directed RNA polymerase subunit delta